MRHSLLAAAFAAFLLCVPGLALAQSAAPPALASTDISKANSGVYNLDPNHASLIFKISHLGFSMYTGRFNELSGVLNFNAAQPEKSVVDITINTNTVDVHNEKLEGELKGNDYFKTAQFPVATFHTTKVVKLGTDKGQLTGDLTMLGVTKPVTLDVTLHGFGLHPFNKKPTLGFAATTTLKRSDWGLVKLLPMVGDDVQISFEGEFNYATPVTVAEPAAAK